MYRLPYVPFLFFATFLEFDKKDYHNNKTSITYTYTQTLTVRLVNMCVCNLLIFHEYMTIILGSKSGILYVFTS